MNNNSKIYIRIDKNVNIYLLYFILPSLTILFTSLLTLCQKPFVKLENIDANSIDLNELDRPILEQVDAKLYYIVFILLMCVSILKYITLIVGNISSDKKS